MGYARTSLPFVEDASYIEIIVCTASAKLQRRGEESLDLSVTFNGSRSIPRTTDTHQVYQPVAIEPAHSKCSADC